MLARTPQRCTRPAMLAFLHAYPCTAPALPLGGDGSTEVCKPVGVAGLVQRRGVCASRQWWKGWCNAGVCVQAGKHGRACAAQCDACKHAWS